nr:AAA-ATPase At3g50940-like [Ziziphus jujuba var. spinosa]
MNFKTLALDSELKKELLEELDNFMNEKEYYQRIGKAWKRGYLLYGPPGTGKTSLIAAMSNHLKFDIYNLDLTDIQNDSHLRFFLLRMSSRAIIVVEDIGCSIKLQNRDSSEDQAQTQGDHNGELAFNYLGLDHHRLFHEIKRLIEEIEVTPAEVGGELMKSRDPQVTLSGLLNFVDGLHSCCRESRIIIFTMNYKGLDQALLRAGRVDTHICLSFCNASIFAQLASTIWGFTVIICLMRSKDDKRDRGESSKSGWRVDEEQYRSSSLFKAL